MKKVCQPHNRPLEDGETLERTIGCRRSNPLICKNHSIPDLCAFIRTDNICMSPPNNWKGLYKQLIQEQLYPLATSKFIKGTSRMAFKTESTGYVKTSLSDLQGAWGNLRASVVEHFGFPDSKRMLFHIDEAMSWESVRNLQRMKSILLVIQNIAVQPETPKQVSEWMLDIRQCMEEAIAEVIENGP